jgi:hypothetical protein
VVSEDQWLGKLLIMPDEDSDWIPPGMAALATCRMVPLETKIVGNAVNMSWRLDVIDYELVPAPEEDER